MTCERQYTQSAVAEMQQIALVAELRRRMALSWFGSQGSDDYYAGIADALAAVEVWLDELAPVTPAKGEIIMFGWGKKDDAEVGVWVHVGGENSGEYQYGFEDTPWGRVGSRGNAQKLLDLTDDEMAALDEYGDIEKDFDGGTMTIESGWFR